MLIGETVRFMIGDSEVEGVVVERSTCDYFDDSKGYVYKIKTENGIVEHVFGICFGGDKCNMAFIWEIMENKGKLLF